MARLTLHLLAGRVLHHREHHRGLVRGLVPAGGGQARTEPADDPGGAGPHPRKQELRRLGPEPRRRSHNPSIDVGKMFSQ